jgi:hypothetical protein
LLSFLSNCQHWYFSFKIEPAAAVPLLAPDDDQMLKRAPHIHRTTASALVSGGEPSSQNGPSPLISNLVGLPPASTNCPASMMALRLHVGQASGMGWS